MAFRATGYWKSMMTPLERSPSRSVASWNTSQKVKQYTTPSNAAPSYRPHNKSSFWHLIAWDHTPIYFVMGMVTVAIVFATHTAKQQLRHCPNVVITKKKRESISEADNPDQALASGQKFVNKSFFRKVAHIQEDKRTLHDPSRPNPFTSPLTAETLKTVGVNPSSR